MGLIGSGYNELGQVAPEALVKAGLCTANPSLHIDGTRLYHILPNYRSHEVKLAKWGFSIIQADEDLYFLGSHPEEEDESPEWHMIQCSNQGSKISGFVFFGEDADNSGAMSPDGQLFWFSRGPSRCTLTPLNPSASLEDVVLCGVATLASETVAVAFRGIEEDNRTYVHQFVDINDLKEWYTTGQQSKIKKRHEIPGTYVSFVGGATAFVLLTNGGNVFTWGENHTRWELGRVPEEETPAEEPSILEDLAGIPVKKVVAQLGLYGALSEYNDLYIWGEVTTTRVDGFKLTDYQDVVNLVDLGDDINVVDFGLGAAHLVCVTENGSIYVMGSNSDEQLLCASSNQIYHKWTELPEIKASAVVCGYWSTFLCCITSR